MVKLDYQLDETWTYNANKPLGMSVKDFLDQAEEERLNLNVSGTTPWAGILD